MCEGNGEFVGELMDLDQFNPIPIKIKSNGQILDLSHLSAEEKREFQELLSGESFEFYPRRSASGE